MPWNDELIGICVSQNGQGPTIKYRPCTALGKYLSHSLMQCLWKGWWHSAFGQCTSGTLSSDARRTDMQIPQVNDDWSAICNEGPCVLITRKSPNISFKLSMTCLVPSHLCFIDAKCVSHSCIDLAGPRNVWLCGNSVGVVTDTWKVKLQLFSNYWGFVNNWIKYNPLFLYLLNAMRRWVDDLSITQALESMSFNSTNTSLNWIKALQK